ncbi:Lipase 2 [Paramyrothecium foliicola]|nr:Lipase 2 [Paramyrothecium foliicola]
MTVTLQKLGTLALAAIIAFPAVTATPTPQQRSASDAPVVTVKNGSYYGVHDENYNQDYFLGMPYAKAPIGDLRFRIPQPLEESWDGTKNATEYAPSCIGYGSDTWVLGNYISEDCLKINVVRPSGVSANDKLPVAVWVHGGSFTTGGSSDPRYNLSFIVEQSVQQGTPIVAVSMNYRLQSWGFLHGHEALAEGSTNVGFRDQRLALHWVQENIASFGGNPEEVTLWGESAGARSVGVQLVAYDGRDDKLFQRAVLQSASPCPANPEPSTADDWEPYFQALLTATGCDAGNRTAGSGLDCLRTVPVNELSTVFNGTLKSQLPSLGQVVDGDILSAPGDVLLRQQKFVKVPILMGTNFDEGTAYAPKGINTTEQFFALMASNGLDNATATQIAELYPDDPSVGIPATLDGRPSGALASLGTQWKRVAAYRGDTQQHGPRRFTTRMYAQAGLPVYSYHFNVRPYGIALSDGATHFQEIVFVFNNVNGLGYGNAVSANPMEGKPENFLKIADAMSKMWVSFFVKGDPNYNARKFILLKVHVTTVYQKLIHGLIGACAQWPEYSIDGPQNLVIDANATKILDIKPDDFRQKEIDFVIEALN